MSTAQEYLSKIYYNIASPPSYAGVDKIWEHIKNDKDRPEGIDRETVGKWLKEQDTHNIFTAPKKDFPTEKIITEYPDQQWEGDVVFINYPKQNRNHKYIMCFVDVFSKFLWARPLKQKTATATAGALESIISESGRKCEVLRTDSGTEFMGAPFQDVLKKNDIFHMRAFGLEKAVFVERVQRTLEDRLYKYFYENETNNFVDILDDIVKAYNNTVHSTTGMAPAAVNQTNFYDIYEKVYLPILNKRAATKRDYAFAIGDLARLSLSRGKFSRGYHQKYTEEIFRVVNVIPSMPPRYKIEDLLAEPVLGSFYKEELLKVNAKNVDDLSFKIEKVISTRKIKGKKFSKVKWLGYGSKFNSTIPTSDLVRFRPHHKKEE